MFFAAFDLPTAPASAGISWPDVALSFFAIVLEGAPFLLLGAIVSGLVDVFLPAGVIKDWLPRSKTQGVFAAIGAVILSVPWWAHRRRRAKVRVERKLQAWPEIAKAIGLAGSEVMSAAVDLWGWRARVRLARGQTIADVTARIPAIESGLGVLILDQAQVSRPRVRDQSHSRPIALFGTIFSRKAPDFPQLISDPGSR